MKRWIQMTLVFAVALAAGYWLDKQTIEPCPACQADESAQMVRNLRETNKQLRNDIDFLWWLCCEDSSGMSFYETFELEEPK